MASDSGSDASAGGPAANAKPPVINEIASSLVTFNSSSDPTARGKASFVKACSSNVTGASRENNP